MTAETAVDLEEREALTVSPNGLPPLPQPDPEKYAEARLGCSLVTFVIILAVAATHGGVHWMQASAPAWLENGFLVVVYIEAFLAFVCLAGIMLVDPGVIERSEKACFPMPTQVQELLAAGEPLSTLTENVVVEKRTYCIRCLVWRDSVKLSRSHSRGLMTLECFTDVCPPGGRGIHHCSTCQRCVRYFDHHCSFFGRCIAGNGILSGNMCFFRGICVLGATGSSTAVASILIGISSSLAVADVGYYIALALLSYLAFVCSLGILASIVCWCWTLLSGNVFHVGGAGRGGASHHSGKASRWRPNPMVPSLIGSGTGMTDKL